MAIHFNQTYIGDEEIVKWNRNPDFRRALCMGLDRDQFNEAFFFGLASPGSAMPQVGNPENAGEDPWRTKWHTYEPEKAMEMLDAIGLDKKDSAGFRLRTDGSGERLTFVLPIPDTDAEPEAKEMVAEQLAEIGIHVEATPIGSQLLHNRRTTDENMWYWYSSDEGGRMYTGSMATTQAFPAEEPTGLGAAIATWFQTGGAEGTEPTWSPELIELLDMYREGLTATREEQIEIAQEIWKIQVDQVLSCGIVGGFGGPRIGRTDVGNVPEGICGDAHCRTPATGRLETWYWTDPAKRGEGE